jgi:hypothetical protein
MAKARRTLNNPYLAFCVYQLMYPVSCSLRGGGRLWVERVPFFVGMELISM